MSFMDPDNSTCDSDPLKLEVDYEVCVETTPNFETSAVKQEIFVKEESSSSSSSSSKSDEDSQDVDFEPNEDSQLRTYGNIEPDDDSQNGQELDIEFEPHNAVSVEFGDCNSVCSASVYKFQEIVQNPTPTYTSPPVTNWPVLEINPGGFINNGSIADDLDSSAIVDVKIEATDEECLPQMDVPKYPLMGDQLAHLGDQSTHSEDESTYFGDHLEDSSTDLGDHSTDLGDQSTHLGDHSTDLGDQSTHLGDQSTHLGDQSTPLADQNTDLGDQNTDLEDQSTHLETRMVYACAKCNASFHVIFDLTKHLRTHGEMPIYEGELEKRRKEEYFIECIKKRPYLWDKMSPSYKDVAMKEKAWRKLGAMFNIKKNYLVKLKWTNLRDMHRFCYLKQQARQKKKPGPSPHNWEYMDHLSFLIPTYHSEQKRNEDIDERLIGSVRKHPCLWDRSKEIYQNYDAKESAWYQVTRECEIKDIPTSKKKWKDLVDTYRIIANKSGASESRKNQWKYYSEMKFVPTFRNIKQSTSVTNLRLKRNDQIKK